MIRTHVISCKLPRTRADALNLESGRVYTGVLVAHWRTVRKKNLWEPVREFESEIHKSLSLNNL